MQDELKEFADDGVDANQLEEQTEKVNIAVLAAEYILLGYSDKDNIRSGNYNLLAYLLSQNPHGLSLIDGMKAVVTTQQSSLLKDYINKMTSDDIPFEADNYYDELYPDYPVNDNNASPSWWHIAEGKKELFAKHIAQMLDEGVFGRRFNLPINSREDFISDIETFFNLDEGELQKLLD